MAEDGRRPAVTVNTATDREMGFERGMVIGYLDTAIDALTHLKHRTGAGRAWLISEDQLDEALGWLTGLRDDVIRKERVDSRPVAEAAPAKPRFVPWTGDTRG